MPRKPATIDLDLDLDFDPDLERKADAALLAFEREFRRSRRGNLWHECGTSALTVFARADGRFSWCIAGPAGPEYGPACETESDALRALARAWGVIG